MNDYVDYKQKPLIEFRNVDVLFGPHPQRHLKLLDQGLPAQEFFSQTGHVIGARSISLSIYKGEIFVLMGLSGSGKSTLLRCINGLNRPTRGSVVIDHQNQSVDLSTCSPDLLRTLRMKRISMVFQQFALIPWRTVGENIAYALELQHIPLEQQREKIDYYLGLVQLRERADKLPSQLSGGMQQRVGLARALATDADILLMDEPFSALDPLIRSELQDELLDLQKKLHKTIVFVCHDFEEAIKLGQRIGIMKNGQLLKLGTATEMMQSEHLSTVTIDSQPSALADREGNFIGVVGGHEIFKNILNSAGESPTKGLDIY